MFSSLGSFWNRLSRRAARSDAKRRAGEIALDERIAGSGFDNLGEPVKGQDSGITITRASDIDPKPVEWLWRNHIAKGKGTLLTGSPGVSKSTMAADIASIITRGGKWPDGGHAPKGNVLFLSSEDAADDTMVPRIMAADGDFKRIGIVRQTVGEKGKRRMIRNMNQWMQQ